MMTPPICLFFFRRYLLAVLFTAAALSAATLSRAATITKANNDDPLNTSSSWQGGLVPGTNDTALWDNTVTGANSATLGANLTWEGLSLSGPDGPVTIQGTQSLGLGTSGINLSANSQLTLNSPILMTSHLNVNTQANATVEINGSIGDGSSLFRLSKDGPGTLILNTANTYKGQTQINGGLLVVNNPGALGTSDADVGGHFTMGNGTALDNTSGQAITLLSPLDITWSNFTFTGTNDLTLGTGNVFLSGETQVSVNASVLTVQGRMVGGNVASLIKLGEGTLELAGINNMAAYDKDVNVNAGTLRLSHALAMNRQIINLQGGTLGFGDIGTTSIGALKGYTNVSLTTALGNPIALAISGNPSQSNPTTYSGVMSGSGSLVMNGGNLILSNANTYVGGTVLQAGTLHLNHPSALGTGPITISGNATLYNSTAAPITLVTNNSVIWDGNLTVQGSNSLNLGAGNFTLTGNRTVTVSGTSLALTIAGPIQGTGKLNKNGSGLLVLAGNNSFSGGIALGNGTLGISHPYALGSGNLTITSGNDKVIDNTSGSPLTVASSNTIFSTDGFVFKGSQSLSLGTANLVLTFTNSLNVQANTLTLAGVISGNSGILKTGAGALTLAAANTFAGGISLSSGTLNLADHGALGPGTFTVTGSGPGTRSLDNTSGQVLAISTNNTLAINANFTFVGTSDLHLGSGPVALNATHNITVLNSTLALAGSISGGGVGLGKEGPGILLLSGLNTYVGSTNIIGGTLVVTSIANGGLSSGIGASNTSATNLILNGGTLRYAGESASTNRRFTIGPLGGTIESAGTGPLELGNTSSVSLSGGNLARTLTLTGANTGNNVLAATIGNSGSVATSLRKDGPGTWLLTGLNTYTGLTTVNGGRLIVNGSIANSTATVSNGAIIGGSGALGPLVVATGGAFAPGNSIGLLSATVFTWNSDNITPSAVFELSDGDNTSDVLAIAGALNHGDGTNFIFDFQGTGNGTFEVPTVYTLITFTSTTFSSASQFHYVNLGESSLIGTFVLSTNSLQLVVIPEPGVFSVILGVMVLTLIVIRTRRQG